MKTASQRIAELGLDEEAEIRKLTSRAKHGWKRHKAHRFFPGQPDTKHFEPAGYTVGVEPPIDFGYPAARAQNDLFRIAAAPDAMAEYVSLYLTRNHLRP